MCWSTRRGPLAGAKLPRDTIVDCHYCGAAFVWYGLETMYVKTTSRTNKDGTPVRYLHLAHNECDPAAGRSVPKVLSSFGREDALDRAAVTRLVASLSKLLDPAATPAATARSHLTLRE